MLKNIMRNSLGSTILKQEQVVKLHQMNKIMDREVRLSVASKIISLFLVVVSFLIEFPENSSDWIMKGAEIITIVIAVYAFSLAIKHSLKRRRINRDKTNLEVEAKKKTMSLERYMVKSTLVLILSIIAWAKFHKIKIKYTRHNHLRNVIDFYDFPIDYIDLNIIDYRLVFTIRVNNLELLTKISEDLPRSCDNLVLVTDKYHIGPRESLPINDEGIFAAKELILGIILSKAYNTVYF
ncbi:MAG TPA: hypothetical protein VJH92_03485 [Candidatus Nanoarchaeia archaeon]|nr:hypothetical protein [Candidatus Nanoarchaeia archaeon]